MDRIGAFAAVALGSNLGDRRAHLAWAIERLSTVLDTIKVSSIHETEPFGVGEAQPPFLNAVVAGTTELGARELLARLHLWERQQGRERPHRWAPRTLDLDLILYGDQVIETEELEVPHPRFRERRFVLEPLAEVAPEAIDPVTGKSIEALLDELKNRA